MESGASADEVRIGAIRFRRNLRKALSDAQEPLFTVRSRRRWRGRVPYVVIDAAVASVDDFDGGPAREECDSQKQRYSDRGGADLACDFCFHKAFALPFPSENFSRRCKNFSKPEFFVADYTDCVGSRHNQRPRGNR